MAIEVNNSNLGPAHSAEQQATELRDTRARTDARKDSNAAGAEERVRRDSVELSRDAHSLRQLQERLERQDSFDRERVEAIKTAISEGRYPIDTQQLARNFFDLERQLNQ